MTKQFDGLWATYSPDDNKLRLYSAMRLDQATCERVKAAGFRWAPKQQVWVAPMWTPSRADLLIELCGSIDDDDSTLVERAEERAERFDEYRTHRAADADNANRAVRALADHIPLGQPILVGHHSERRARRDAARIQAGLHRAAQMWQTAQYWERRAAAARRHAKYKERPDVRMRRIQRIEADKRKQERTRDQSRRLIGAWTKLGVQHGHATSPEHVRREAIALANVDGGCYRAEHTFPSGYVGPLSLWEAAGGNIDDQDPSAAAIATPGEVRGQAIKNHEALIAYADRWIEHFDLRLGYERAMLDDVGGIVADQRVPEKGGACRCWASLCCAWSYVQKVNKVSVTVLDNWGNGGPNFSRTIPFDKLTDVMTKGDVDAARAAGRIIESKRDALGTMIGFALRPLAPES